MPLPWQLTLWQYYSAVREQGRLHHATLLVGQRHVGKQHFAEAMAQLLLCRSPQSGIACGRCKACELLAAGSHSDLHRIEPEEEGKAIKIDQIRQLLGALAGTSQQGGSKVVVIGPLEALNINAANAFLKSLEEPTANTYFLMFSHSPERLLPTIRSRCSIQRVELPPEDLVLPWLDGYARDRQEAQQLLSQAAGAPLLAREFARDPDAMMRPRFIQQLAEMRAGQLGPLALAQQWHKQGLEEMVLPTLQTLMHQLMVVRLGSPATGPLAEIADEMHSSGVRAERVYRYWDELLKARGVLRSSSNPNPQLLLEGLLLDLQSLTV